MTRRIPIVRDGMLYEEAEGVSSDDAIEVESAVWYDWLERHHSFRFECSTSAFTARKEPRAGSWYWYAYRRQSGRLHTAYLGKSIELSLARLQVIGDALAGTANAPTPPTQVSEQVPDSPVSSVSEQVGASTPGSMSLYNLPQPLTSLVGREQEVVAAAVLLQRPEVRLLSMVGTGGVGKTRLALQVATDLQERFADGVFFVALAPLRDPQLVFSTLVQTLRLTVMGGQSFLNQLKTYLREKHCLLLLDNFEQVIEAAPQLSELLEACSYLKLLVTSREVLHLRGEHQFSVPPLALPERKRLPDVQALARVAAVELFLQRVQTIKPDVALTKDNAAAIAEICHRLDGLPLAIELAAARVNIFAPQALLVRLERRLQVLTGGARDLPERQRTLRSAIAWSYELLPVEEQRLFRLLAAFVGGCTLEAVEAVSTAVGDSGANVLEGIGSLVDKSLLQQIGRDGEEPRFTMLETIREYGLECLATSGEMEAIRQAHAAYYLRLAEQAAEEFDGPQQAMWFECLTREYENLRAVLQWSLAQASTEETEQRLILGLQLAKALRAFWAMRGHCKEGLDFLERTLVRGEGIISTSERARALDQAGGLAYFLGETNRAVALLKESLRLRRELADAKGIASSLLRLGMVAAYRSDFAEARSLTEEALALFRAQENQERISWSLLQLARIACQQGAYSEAYALGQECLTRYRAQGDTKEVANTLYLLAEVIFHSQGDVETAHAMLQEAALNLQEMDDTGPIYLVLPGYVALQRGDVSTARMLAEESLSRAREGDAPDDLALALVLQGWVNASQGNFMAARAFYEESLAIARQKDLKLIMASGLEGLAAVVAAQGEAAWAGRLWGRAIALREAIGAPLPPVYHVAYDHAVAATRTQPGEQVFAAAWEEGRTMTLDHVLSARSVTVPMGTPAKPSSVPHPQKVLTTFAVLTPRELEVLRLLAQGLTSAQIAERLVIGLVTVNSHVRSIYSKLGVTSRSAATRYAIEHRLV